VKVKVKVGCALCGALAAIEKVAKAEPMGVVALEPKKSS
jgi:hypothetical protein